MKKLQSLLFAPFLIFTLFILSSPLLAIDAETSLKNALEKANRGETQQAISELEGLKRSLPNDARVSLSLGLLYQSADRMDEAIPELENANRLSPSIQATYALGLLYESKWLKTDQETWKIKATGAWEQCLQLTSMEHPHRVTIERHLKRLRNNG